MESSALFHPHCQAPLGKVGDTEPLPIALHCRVLSAPWNSLVLLLQKRVWMPTTTHGEHTALQTLLKAIRKMEKLKPRQRSVIWCCLQLSCGSDRCLTVPQNQDVLAQSSMCQYHCCQGQSCSPVKSLDPQSGAAPGSLCGCAVPYTQPSLILWLQQPPGAWHVQNSTQDLARH